MIKERVIFIYSMVILIFTCLKVNSQTCEVLNPYVDRIYSINEIYKLENRICKLLKKQKAIPDNNKINIYYIPNYDIPDYHFVSQDSIEYYYLSGKSAWKIKKNDFIDSSFLKKLSREPEDYFKSGRDYINSQIIVTNSSGKLIAFGDARDLCIADHYSTSYIAGKTFIADKILELNIKYLFKIPSLWMLPIFGITEKNKIVVFIYEKEDNKIYSIEEFIDMYSKDEEYKKQFND